MKAAKPPAFAPRKPAAPAGTPWTAVVAEMRAAGAEDHWRLCAITRLPYWPEFTVGWAAVAPSVLRRAALPRLCPDSLADADRRGEWAWQQVERYVSPVLHLVHDRTSIPDLAVLEVFGTLRGAGLLYPDGSAHDKLLQKLGRRAQLAEMTAVVRIGEKALEHAKIRRSMQQQKGTP